MRELALHILDIAQNSVTAGGTRIKIEVDEQPKDDFLKILIEDNGCGMSPETLARVTDPFVTSRTTRKVGLGLPLLKLAAENTGGELQIRSEKGKGTSVCAVFGYGHIDRQPLGNMAETILGLVTAYENVDFLYIHHIGEAVFEFDSAEVKKILDDVPIGSPDVYMWLSEYLSEGEREIEKN